MITDKDVRHFAGYITGHPDATTVDSTHLAATRAVLDGLAQEGRLLPARADRRTMMLTTGGGEGGSDTEATIHLEGIHEIFRFAVNMLGWQVEFGAAAHYLLVDLRDQMSPARFDPMAKSLLGPDQFDKMRDRFERNWFCVGCDKEIRPGWMYYPTNQAGAACAACCKGYDEYKGKLVKRLGQLAEPMLTTASI